MHKEKIKKLIEEANSLADEGLLEEAVEKYSEIIAINPDNVDAFFLRGAAYHELEDFESAKDDALRVIDLDPEHEFACFNAGIAYGQLGENEDSVYYFKKAVAINPEYASAHFALGNVAYFNGNYKTAIEYYENAIKYGVKYHDTYFVLGRSYAVTGDFENALHAFEHFEYLLDDTPPAELMMNIKADKESIMLPMGILQYMLENDERAREYLTKVPESDRTEHNEARVYLAAIEKINGNEAESGRYARGMVDTNSPQPYMEYSEAAWMLANEWIAFEDRFKKCPDCRTIFVEHRGVPPGWAVPVEWSDGFREGENFAEDTVIVKCRQCGKWHFVSDLETFFSHPPDVYSELTPEISQCDNLTGTDYEEALLQDFDRNREFSLRRRLLWCQNHRLRHGKEPPLPVDPEQHTNLERLAEIIDRNFYDYFYIEICRELGDFKSAKSALQELEKTANEYDLRIRNAMRAAVEERRIEPVVIKKNKNGTERGEGGKTQDASERLGFRYEQRRDYGFDIFPQHEDIFAFPERSRVDDAEPILSVLLSLIDKNLDGWATFFYEDISLIHRHDRLFTEEEWNEFNGYKEEWRNDLIWFWSFKSWEKPRSEEELDKYYKILYQLFYYTPDYVKESEILKMKEPIFDPFMRELKDEVSGHGGEEADSVNRNWSRIYWDLFWQFFIGEFEYPDCEKLFKYLQDESDYYENLEQSRRRAFEGLPYVEIGGFPSWFQGLDKTQEIVPLAGKQILEGNLDFIGQFWTDYLNWHSKLVYLFYDTDSQILYQMHDYD